ncbi:hypothetical protein FRC07_003645 [Ceratobasidium sp. 392]|nr:hypothetical protein FRC07_003645 [Ceratobasidium sp. 392]
MNYFILHRPGIAALNSLKNLATFRLLHGRVAAPPPPAPRGSYQSPGDFLAAIGRSSNTKLKVETWDDLWRTRGEDMKKAGLTPAERR